MKLDIDYSGRASIYLGVILKIVMLLINFAKLKKVERQDKISVKIKVIFRFQDWEQSVHGMLATKERNGKI